ncbi:hypothetical protein [Vibrio splendidus]|uniref:hypothetical protein n=1 Tax=Vibrio splendidus TaxID=29497 RepID=UPI0021B489E1|nr:hypothetical protein [Vibrio splendidus]UWZ98599.1 hypothetical protein IM698_04380 [Vibrio splendidus]
MFSSFSSFSYSREKITSWELDSYNYSISSLDFRVQSINESNDIIIPMVSLKLDKLLTIFFLVESDWSYCSDKDWMDPISDVFIVQGKKVAFKMECVGSRDVIKMTPLNSSGSRYLFDIFLSSEVVEIEHFLSGVVWEVSSLGFRELCVTVKSWSNFIEQSL